MLGTERVVARGLCETNFRSMHNIWTAEAWPAHCRAVLSLQFRWHIQFILTSFPPSDVGSFKCCNLWGGHDNHVTSLMMSQHCNSISAPWWNSYWGCSGLESRLPWSKEKLSHVIDASIDLQHLQTTIDSDKYNMKIIIQWWSGFLHWWRQTVTIRSMVHFNCLLINRKLHGMLQSMLN